MSASDSLRLLHHRLPASAYISLEVDHGLRKIEDVVWVLRVFTGGCLDWVRNGLEDVTTYACEEIVLYSIGVEDKCPLQAVLI